MAKKSKRISVRVTERFHERIERAMKLEGLSKTELITYAIKEYIEKIEEREIGQPPD